jgi:hypothetical protein
MSEIKEIIATLRELFARATPQNIDSAQKKGEGDIYECPFCTGEGYVDCATFTNYDHCAIGVQFFGIGAEHLRAEQLYRGMIQHVPRLLDLIEPAQTEGQ